MHARFLMLALLLSPLASAQAQSRSDTCAVWDAETSFAQSVADHDPVAFAAHLHPDAVFVDGGNRPTRGAAGIAEAWAGLIDGKGIVLHWYPDAVDVAAGGQLALSRGPYWMENPAAPPATRYRRGRFSSTWQRGADGQWLVVFDGGGGNVPVPASAADIAALAAARKPCPVP
jgi:ketosteroid isomerase-like protein